MPDRDEIEKLAKRLYYQRGSVYYNWENIRAESQSGYQDMAEHILATFVPRTEHDLLVGAFRKEVKFWKQKYGELEEELKTIKINEGFD